MAFTDKEWHTAPHHQLRKIKKGTNIKKGLFCFGFFTFFWYFLIVQQYQINTTLQYNKSNKALVV